ncbi:MAG: sulfatase [bacterium]|jgi:arylsulfatase A-like enzyme|nr:hypothetical protein [Planctomycetota bacterium]
MLNCYSRSVLLAAGLSQILVACGGAPEGPRNVILVTLDTTRPDFFGCYGASGDLTPRLDALAQGGARFDMAISASAVTPVSHASILTGQLPYQHGLRVLAAPGGFRLPETVPTLASILGARGYTTAAIHSAFPVSRIYGFERGFDLFEDLSNVDLEQKQDGGQGWDVSRGQRRSDQTSDMAIRFLQDCDEPFFLWLHYWDPHDMVLTPDKEFMAGREPTSPADTMAFWREMYALEISYVDREFGRVLDALEEGGRDRDTLIAVISDHGEGLDDGERRHGWRAHRILYQEQVHVPLILAVPGGPRGLVVDSLVRSIDVFPTVLDYLDVAPPAGVEGLSLRPLLEGRKDAPRMAYADQINGWDANAGMVRHRPQADFLHMAMDDTYKLIYRPSFPDQSELYNYRRDPGEILDLFGREEFRATRVALLSDLAARAGWVLAPFQADGEPMSERDRAILQKLGYTGDGEAASEALWEWLCPADWTRHGDPGPCPRCGAACLPAAAGRQE